MKKINLTLLLILVPLSFVYSGGGNAIKDEINILGETHCGQIGQPKCNATTKEFWEMGGCDYGLKSKWNWKSWKSYCVMGTRKSAKIDPWIPGTLHFQRSLNSKLPFNKVTSVGVHNSQAPARTHGNLLMLQGNLQTNQEYSITDLLDMGVRDINIDVHYYNKTLRACHAMGDPYHFGCSPRARYWSSWVEELRNWIFDPKNNRQIVMIDVENRTKDANGKRHDTELMAPFMKYLSSIALETSHRKNYKWPTMEWMLQNNKRIIFMTQSGVSGITSEERKYIFSQRGSDQPHWDRNYPEYFKPETCKIGWYGGFPDTHGERNTNYWRTLTEDRSFLTKVMNIFTKAFMDKDGHLTLTNQNIKDATRCNITGWEMDYASPSRIQHGIWSWDTGQPYNWGKGLNCAQMSGKEGRWKSADCSQKAHIACSKRGDPYDWKLSNETIMWELDKANELCGLFGDYAFSIPVNGFQNDRLQALRRNEGEKIWINFARNPNASQTGPTIPTGSFKIQSNYSNKYFTSFWGKNIIQYSDLRRFSSWHKRQLWKAVSVGNNQYKITTNTGSLCLESGPNNANVVYQKSCSEKDTQKWTFNPMGNDLYQIINASNNRCLDIQGSMSFKKYNYRRPMTYNCYNVSQHKFKIIPN